MRKKKRKCFVRNRPVKPQLVGPNQEWAMDFLVDGLYPDGWRVLSLVTAYTREYMALKANVSLGSGRLTNERVIVG